MNIKKASPAGGTAEQATETAAFGRAATSCNHSTTTAASSQPAGRISALLVQGEENAIPGSELAQMAGVNPRTLRLMVDQERLKRPICASDNGYFLPDSGNKGIMELRRFIRRQDSRCSANRRVTRSARVALKALEKAPLPGQTDLWQGGDADG